jgi:hypothetical protein
MEDVLEVYHRPHDPQRPVVCLDECSKQLIGEVRTLVPPRPAQEDRPGRVERYDCEYLRNGTANLFMAFEPLGGWREVAVTDRRRREDWARFVRELVDGRYREADKLILVMDQLNTHSPASLYEAFAPEEAKRIAERLEIHHTPKHGSWLNMAEIELSALGRDPGLRRGRLCRTGSATGPRWSATSRLGSIGATPPPSGPIGRSPPKTPASSSANSIRQWKNDRTLASVSAAFGLTDPIHPGNPG